MLSVLCVWGTCNAYVHLYVVLKLKLYIEAKWWQGLGTYPLGHRDYDVCHTWYINSCNSLSYKVKDRKLFLYLTSWNAIALFTSSFIQLDLGKLQIKNEFSWHGSQEEDPSAVHIDVLHAQVYISVIWPITIKILDIFLTPNELQILGINMSVGIDGCLGKPMIREGQGLDIFVRRSLRDVFRKVPTFSLEVKVTLNTDV